MKQSKVEEVEKELAKAGPQTEVEETTPESNISDVTFSVASRGGEYHWFDKSVVSEATERARLVGRESDASKSKSSTSASSIPSDR